MLATIVLRQLRVVPFSSRAISGLRNPEPVAYFSPDLTGLATIVL